MGVRVLGDDGASRLMNGLRIAYLCLQAATEGQASYAHVNEIAAGLRKRGHRVDVFQPSFGPGDGPGPLGRLLDFIAVQRRLVRVLGDYDLIYIRSHPLAYPTAARARRRGRPVVQECNGPYTDFYQAWPVASTLRWLLEPMARRQYEMADAVIAVTPELADWVNHEASRSDAAVIPNGANTEVFHPDAAVEEQLPERFVVFFGSLAPWQGVDVMLRAASDPAWPNDVALVVVGDGKLRGRVESAAAANRRIACLGSRPYRAVGGVVSRSIASLVVKHVPVGVTLRMSPLKLYESMASGVPVVVSDFDDLARIVAPIGAGLVVPQDDAAALAQAVAWIARHPSEAREMGRRGRDAVVASHSWEARARQTADVVDGVFARRSRGAVAVE
jgi:glycosyltransferase involved in cell wall biosynthesis